MRIERSAFASIRAHSWFRFGRPYADSLWPRGTRGCVCRIAALALILPVGACFSYPKIPAVGYLANKPISTTVDSQLAKYYLEASSTHIFPNANANERIADVERRFEGRARLVDIKRNLRGNLTGFRDHIFYQSQFVRLL
jgi:hypothetical protein